MENEQEKITKNTIEIDQEKYEQLISQNASFQKEIEYLKSSKVDQDTITVSSVKKDEPIEKPKKKGILI